jgi:hypothetical protein
MKTFTFIEKNGSGVISISATDFDNAIDVLEETVAEPMGWRVENEDGENEDEDFIGGGMRNCGDED